MVNLKENIDQNNVADPLEELKTQLEGKTVVRLVTLLKRFNLCFSKVFPSKFYKINLLVKSSVKVGDNGVYSRAEMLLLEKCYSQGIVVFLVSN